MLAPPAGRGQLPPDMSKLLAAIRAEAEAQLVLPAGQHPAAEIERYQRFLRRQALRIRLAHNKGAGGREVCQARSLAVDLVFEHALRAVLALPARTGNPPPPFAVVALGGYGRAELSPHSDVDVMFLHNRADVHDAPRPPFMELMNGAWLFNVFPKVQPLVRTPAQCVEAAREDLRSMTSLLEARRVCGDERLFAAMQKRLLAGAVKGGEDAYIEQRLKDQAGRRERFGNTPFLQEPNVKHGCGGLRDYQNLLWMAFFRYRVRTTAELAGRGLITPREQATLDAAYEFLLRVRNDLHYRAGRANDVLTKSVQPQVARAMGFTRGSPRVRLERLMQTYYRHVRTIHELTRTLEERLALHPQPGRLPRLRHLWRAGRQRTAETVDGFKFVDGAVLAASDRVFRDQPHRLMRAFSLAQRRGLRLHPELVHLIRNHTHLVTREFRADPQVREMFFELFRHRGRVGGTLRQMHETGLLGALVPAFGRLTGQVQHEFFHQFTADEHTLVCLEKLDAIWEERLPGCAPYAAIFRKVPRPEVLYLALLLHDAGKGGDHDHAESGARLAASVVRWLRLDPATAGQVVFLVRHHLAMVTLSQKRDLDDPAVVEGFARLVGDAEKLHMLTLLTVADSLGTSDTLWNAFKDQLLLMLHARAEQHLAGAIAPAGAVRRDELLAAVREARPSALAPDEIEAHFTGLPESYFQHISLAEVLADLGVVHDFLAAQVRGERPPLAPAIRTEAQPARGCSVVRVCAWDHSGLFAGLAGALTVADLNILSAEIYTRTDNLVLDRFYVAEPATGAPAGERALESFASLARQALTGELSLPELLRRARGRRTAGTRGERVPTRIAFDNQASASRTVIEIETEDRLGLLAALAAGLAALGVDISLAKINTTHGVAEDAFYVTEADGGKIVSAARQQEIRHRLLTAIAELG